MKKILCISVLAALMAAVTQGEVVYQSDFTGADLASAGLTATAGINGTWMLDTANDVLSGARTTGNPRGNVYTTESWQGYDGFTLEVTFNQEISGARYSFGIVDADYTVSVSSDSFNKGSAGAYGIGYSALGELSDSLIFNNGSGSAALSTGQGANTPGTVESMTITITAHSYSYSLNGAEPTTGSLSFDTSRAFRFVAHAQDVDEQYISGITLTKIPNHPEAPVQLEFLQVFQSSDSEISSTADQAVDDNTSTFSLTDNLPASYWQAELGRPFELDRIEIANRLSPNDAEMDGLTLTLFNIDDQVVYETVLSSPGSGAISTNGFPAGTFARKVRIGLSGSDVNGAGTYRVGLADVRLFGEPTIPYTPASDVWVPTANLATAKPSTIVKLSYDEAPASNANDGDYSTYARTQWQAFDGYPSLFLNTKIIHRYAFSGIPRKKRSGNFLPGFLQGWETTCLCVLVSLRSKPISVFLRFMLETKRSGIGKVSV